MAVVHWEQGRFAEADVLFQLLMELNDGKGSSAFVCAVAAYHVLTGDFEAAIRSLRTAVKLGW